MMRTVQFLKTRFTSLLDDRGGNFAMMTALLAAPLLIVAGVAVDYSYAASQRTHLQEIADAAALEGGKIFDGTNLSVATTAAKNFLKGYSAQMPGNVTSTMTADGRVFKVALNASVDTSLMKVANVNSVAIAAGAGAIAPAKPTNITFDPTYAKGFWYKKISVMVVRPGSTAETTLATIVYQPTTLADDGKGTMTMVPATGTIDLGNYTKLILKMEIKKDYCPTGYSGKEVSPNRTVKCTATNQTSSKVYDSTLRTDNPNQMDSLYVDGKQLQKGTAYPLEAYFGCAAKQSHAWEDGGGGPTQDFFYTVSADCSGSDGNYVRLTQ